jgi:predicted MFS family arabinose efflux permease
LLLKASLSHPLALVTKPAGAVCGKHVNRAPNDQLQWRLYAQVPMSHTTLTPQRERWLLLTLAGIQFTYILDFMVMMPLGPQFTRLFDISDAQFGALVSAYTFSAGASGLAASAYMDRFDRKRLLVVLYTLFALSTMGCALAMTYGQFFVARVGAGLFGGVLSALIQTILADVVPFERRGRAMGVVMSSFSVSTVAGVPLGLYLAAAFSWHAPFWLVVGLCGVFGAMAYWTVPQLRAHLDHPDRHSVWGEIVATVQERNHQWSFAFTMVSILTGFMIIPYITIYLETNLAVSNRDIPLLYLAGGAATLVSARWIGVLSDRLGKRYMYERLAALVGIPLFTLTLMPPAPFWVLTLVYVLFFVIVSGRMIPSMAVVSAAANPRRRGTFMAISGALQSFAMGLAALVGGLIIGRSADGQVTGYWITALLGTLASFASVWLIRRIQVPEGKGPISAPKIGT